MKKIIAWIQSQIKRIQKYFKKEEPRVIEIKQEPVKTKNLRAEIEELLEGINPARYAKYKPSDGLWVDMDVPWNNIEVYTRKVRFAAHLVTKEREVARDWYPETSSTVSVDRFLLTESGQYQEKVVAIDDFRDAGLSLCRALAPCDSDQFGPYSHNYRMLLRLLLNLKVMAKALTLDD